MYNFNCTVLLIITCKYTHNIYIFIKHICNAYIKISVSVLVQFCTKIILNIKYKYKLINNNNNNKLIVK